MNATPAGWYPDPQDAAQLRYWDGQAWTESTSPAAPQAPVDPTPPPAASPYGAPAASPYPTGDQAGGHPAYAPYPPQSGMPSPYAQPAANPSNTLSIIGIVCGGIAFLFCPLGLGIAGLVLGFVARSKGERLAKWALIVSALGLVIGTIIGIVIAKSLHYY